MTVASISRTRRAVFWFIATLVLFLIVSDAVIVTQQKHIVQELLMDQTRNEFDLFSKLVIGSLTKGDYVSVQEAVFHWGLEQKSIVSLVITTANKFTVADYHREKSASVTESINGSFIYGHNNNATISLVKDVSSVRDYIRRLTVQLLLISTALVAMLGIALQRVAIRPLQREIREHEQTEIKLKQQATTLRETNRELESYSYSIAHDLRTPLRTIVGFCQILQEDTCKKLSLDEMKYFDRIIAASKRMAELIDDILELGRVTRLEMNSGHVDLTDLAHKAIEKMSSKTHKSNIDWRIESGLSATGDRRLLQLLMNHLLGNACKYTCMSLDPKVEFTCTQLQQNGKTVKAYVVRDNGVGFSMHYADKLFKPFHRLHTDTVFDGSGIGLAIAERIVHRHGGRIWAKAEENKGAQFYFTLEA